MMWGRSQPSLISLPTTLMSQLARTHDVRVHSRRRACNEMPFRTKPSRMKSERGNRHAMSALYLKYPLDAQKYQIRLLILHPGAWEEGLSCDFKVVSLEDRPMPLYSALSYVWGDDAPGHIVTIDGVIIPIRESLFTALRRLRAHAMGSTTLLWADALCIYQLSTDERNHQVGMMDIIYYNAEDVRVWLGELGYSMCIGPDPGRTYTIQHIRQNPATFPKHEMVLHIAHFLDALASSGTFEDENFSWAVTGTGIRRSISGTLSTP